MDQVRNFYGSNQSTFLNLLYLVAFGILVYYLFMYYRKSKSFDIDLLKKKLKITGNRPTDTTALKDYDVVINDGKTNLDIRAKETGAYTLSFWMYLTGYSTTQKGYQSILCMRDVDRMSGTDTRCLLFLALHPTQPKMFVNVGCLADDTTPSNMELIGSNGVWQGQVTTTSAIPATDANNGNTCNVVDVDMQRWIHVAVTVNKQIVDVYMDGKLSRSCVLPKPQKPSETGQQTLHILPAGDSFNGYMSGIHFSAYADTPDQIYARYQSGPYTSVSFMDYLSDKIGIRVQYSGVNKTEFSEWNLKSILTNLLPSE